MKKILSFAFVLMFLFVNSALCVDINDFKRGDGSIPVKGTDSVSDIDTLISNYIVDPLNVLLANYRQGCSLSYTSTTVVTIGIGEVSTSDSGGTVHRFRKNTSTVTVDFAVDGVGGLDDSGTIAASTTYYIYADADATATTFTGIASLSATTPTGVTNYKRLGYVVTNSSAQLQSTYVINDEAIPQVGFGAWVSRTDNTVYQAATDGFVTAYSSASGGSITMYTDSSNPPTTLRVAISGVASGYNGLMMPVKKGDYYKFDWDSGSATGFWIPLGS